MPALKQLGMFEEKAEISLISGIYRVSGFIGWNSSTASVVDPSVFGAPELGASIRQYSHSRVSAGNSFQDPLWHQNLRGLRPLSPPCGQGPVDPTSADSANHRCWCFSSAVGGTRRCGTHGSQGPTLFCKAHCSFLMSSASQPRGPHSDKIAIRLLAL